MNLNRIMSKKLQIDENNDSLLEEPFIKKFIGVSQRVQPSPIISHNNNNHVKQKLNLKFLTPQV